jgi:hypothetical protein
MNFFGKKKKNDEVRRPSPWLMLVVGFLLGVVFMLLTTYPRVGTPTVVYSDGGLELTSTAIIAGATGTAQARQSASDHTTSNTSDLYQTATAIIAGVTAQATDQIAFPTLDGPYLTATAIVAGATATMMSRTQVAP